MILIIVTQSTIFWFQINKYTAAFINILPLAIIMIHRNQSSSFLNRNPLFCLSKCTSHIITCTVSPKKPASVCFLPSAVRKDKEIVCVLKDRLIYERRFPVCLSRPNLFHSSRCSWCLLTPFSWSWRRWRWSVPRCFSFIPTCRAALSSAVAAIHEFLVCCNLGL